MQGTAAGCTPHVLVLHLTEAVLSADAAAVLSRVLVQERLQHSLRQGMHASGSQRRRHQENGNGGNDLALQQMGMLRKVGRVAAAHLDGVVTICGRDDIQVQVAISKLAVADCLQADKL